jgi:hypothetical protein
MSPFAAVGLGTFASEADAQAAIKASQNPSNKAPAPPAVVNEPADPEEAS